MSSVSAGFDADISSSDTKILCWKCHNLGFDRFRLWGSGKFHTLATEQTGLAPQNMSNPRHLLESCYNHPAPSAPLPEVLYGPKPQQVLNFEAVQPHFVLSQVLLRKRPHALHHSKLLRLMDLLGSAWRFMGGYKWVIRV